MEFWPENQGQSPLYSKFGTLPGRNCTHNYHDRHQVTHYPWHYGEQQDQSRESSYWTLPGSRTGGAPQEYANWTDQELTGPAPSHFPFILDHHHPRQHQDLGEYQPLEARDREWTAAQRAARDYERDFLREGWQRRWEPCSPARYNREVSTKRNDSSYRELEAWAARYSHSLPRRRRIEAELRGASQGLLESNRDSRSGTDPRLAALQQVLQSENIRESGLWDRGARQQAQTYYPSQTLVSDTSHLLAIKEKTGYQRRMFSQPPGYIAPPPYNSPHKSCSVLHHSDTRWEQEGKRQTYWSQPAVRKPDVSVDHRKGEKEDLKKTDTTQYTFSELEELKPKKQATDALQASSPISIQKPHVPCESTMSVQQPEVLQAVQNKMILEEPSSKVIEGRKFRLNKKTGGLTIFCLVSRIATTNETPSLPLCTSLTNIQNTELEGVSKDLMDSGDKNQTDKLADEVDFKAPTLIEQSNTSDAGNHKAKPKETPTRIDSELLEDNLSNKTEAGVSLEKVGTNNDDSTLPRQATQSLQPVSVKYPLWREPSFTSRSEIESSSTSLKENSEEGELSVLHSLEDSADDNPIDTEVKSLDIKDETQSEDSKGLLVIDTTCVVVKMELIPSPKKEHVHFLDSTPVTEHSPLEIQSAVSPDCVQSNSQLNQDMTIDQKAETSPVHINEKPGAELDSDLVEKKAPEGESENSFPCMSSSSVSERETLKERAERILGIPLHDGITEQQPADAKSLLDMCMEDQDTEPSPIIEKDINDLTEEITEDTKVEELPQNQVEDSQNEDAVCLQEKDDGKDQVANEGGQDLAQSQKQGSSLSEDNDIDLHLKTDINASPEIEMAEDPLLKSSREEHVTEQSQEENQPIENETSSQHPSQCLSVPANISNSSPTPSLDCEAPNHALSLMLSISNLTSLSCISESNIGEDHNLESSDLNSVENLSAYPETSSLPHTPSQQLPSPPPPSADYSPSFTPCTDSFPSTFPNLTNQTAEAESRVEDQDQEGEPLQTVISEMSHTLEESAKSMTEEQASQEPFESGQPIDDVCVKDSNFIDEQQTKEAIKDCTDDIMEQRLEISQENAAEVNILQQQIQCVQAEDIVCVKESHMTEKQLLIDVNEDPTDKSQPPKISKEAIEINSLQQQIQSDMTEEELPKEVTEEPTGLLEQTIFQEIVTESPTQTEVDILQQHFDKCQEVNTPCLEETCMREEQSKQEANEDPMGLLEDTISKENAKAFGTQTEISQDIEPKCEPSNTPPTCSTLDCDAPQPTLDVLSPSELPSPPQISHKSDTVFVPLLEMDSVLNLDAAAVIPETILPPLQLDSCNEPLQLSSFSDSPPGLPSPSIPRPQQESESVSPDLPPKGEPQYPKSLWDAVNRIRKHTAPDSENEEEEVSELWDPESVGEDLGLPDEEEAINLLKIVADEAGQQEVLTDGSAEGAEVGKIRQDLSHEELSGHAEEDTLSCGSTSSQGSGDTVIVAEDDEVKEMPPDAGTESKTENVKEFQMDSDGALVK